MTAQRSLADALRWTDEGTAGFLDALTRTSDAALAGPTALPGWTGRHLVAHVAANADALRNLAHWAATGVETPMYSSPQQRDADIRAGAERPPVELRRWARESADRLAAAYAVLGDEQWACIVRTAQGRLVAAAEIPWLRAREVMVHTVDLDPAPGFAGLPEDFVVALVDDVVSRRSSGDQPALELSADGDLRTWSAPGTGEPAPVRGTLGGIAAYLTGRPGADVTSPSGAVPDLPPWL